jgi:serine/threonine protein phosphatase PrpC
LHKSFKVSYAVKTKAGTNGKQAKINQDIAIVDVKLPFGLKVFGVCDGHGTNGHLVSAFIKAYFISNCWIK